MTAVTTVPPSTFGIPALRTEDPRFLTGQGRYLENIAIPGALRAVFVRSIFAHATVNAIEGLDDARAMPGIVAVYTGLDLALPDQSAAGSVEAPGVTWSSRSNAPCWRASGSASWGSRTPS